MKRNISGCLHFIRGVILLRETGIELYITWTCHWFKKLKLIFKMHCRIVLVDCLFLYTILILFAYRAGDLSSNPSKPDNFLLHNTKNVNIILVIDSLLHNTKNVNIILVIDSLLSTTTFYKKIKIVNKNKQLT